MERLMVTAILKFSDIKKNPNILLGCDVPAAITKYGDIKAYVVLPERMQELLAAEKKLKEIGP